MGRGKFVEGGVAQKEDDTWHSSARITKSGVDTFLFVMFNYEKPVNLEEADFFVIESVTPNEQRTPTPLRVIVRDAHGAECIANFDRSLGDPGQVRCFVPLTQFERAGWDQTGNSSFDWSAVTAIRLGWGGYIGAEGESIEFTCTRPQTGQLGD